MIIFARPHCHYDSYTDFWKLVELSGFRWCWLDEIDLKINCAYIVSPVNDEWKPPNWWHRRRKNARLILWDLERPKPRGGIAADRYYLAGKHFDEIWVSDAQLAKDLGARFVILGSDERLGNKPGWTRRYNFTHISYENGRRATVYEQLKRVGPNGWGIQRDKVLKQTRFGLSVHQDNDLYTEPLRMAIFAAYGLPVISETIADSFPIADCLMTADYEDLAGFARGCLGYYRKLKSLGDELKHKLCFEYRFRNMVEYAVRS